MKNPVFITIGGGKGGIGKSTVTSLLASTLAQKGLLVGLIDADLGGANLHTFVGCKRPVHGLQDFLNNRVQSLNDLIVTTAIPNTWLISGINDGAENANPKFSQKQRLISHIKNLKADYIFIDLAAGSGNMVTDFYAAFANNIVVSDSLPTSIENAYAFLKNGIIRGLSRLFPDRQDIIDHVNRLSISAQTSGFSTVAEMVTAMSRHFPKESFAMKQWLITRKNFLVLNMVQREDDIKTGTRFADMVKKYLSCTLYYIGYIHQSPEVRNTIRNQAPLTISSVPQLAGCMEAITTNIMTLTRSL
jgi:flagellar biosynthesis protein FlhG